MMLRDGWKWASGRPLERFLGELARRGGFWDGHRGRPSQAQLAAAFGLQQQTVNAWTVHARAKAPPMFRLLLHDYAARFGWCERALRERWEFVPRRSGPVDEHPAVVHAQHLTARVPEIRASPQYRAAIERARREVDEALGRLERDLARLRHPERARRHGALRRS